MASEFGTSLRVSVFGQSHSSGIGAVIDGLPAGEEVDLSAVWAFMARRAPGRLEYTTQRSEADEAEILSGLLPGKKPDTMVSCGAPLAILIRNKDTRSQDYDNLRRLPRPGHADYTANCKYGGFQDVRGGGHFSGRLTAPLCFAGAVAKQVLARRGIEVGAHIARIGQTADVPFDPVALSREALLLPGTKSLAVTDDRAGLRMIDEILAAKNRLDSVGGIVECGALGLPVGLGAPMFDGVENRLAAALFGIPAVKGVEFGDGFGSAALLGSENNDAYEYGPSGEVRTRTNHSGGILGGITNGMPLIVRAAFKPTPSISREQDSIDLLEEKDAKLIIKGRHDPCIVTRAVAVVEAVAAVVLLDLLLSDVASWQKLEERRRQG